MTDSTDNKKNNEKNKQESELADNIGKVVHGDTKAVKDVYEQAKKSTGVVAEKIYDTAAKTASSKINEQKSNLASSLAGVADSIRQIGESFGDEKQPYGVAKLTADYGNTLADKVEQVSSYLEGRDLGKLINDVEDFAHRNPILFIGGAFALGVVAARFLKSGNSNQSLMRRERYEIDGKYLPDEHEGVHLPKDLDEQVRAKENKSARTKGA